VKGWGLVPSLPLGSLSLSRPFPLSPSLPLPLEVGPLIQLEGLGERCKLPSWFWGEPQPKLNLVHFSLKI